MSFDGNIYVHGKHSQLLMMKEKYDTSKNIDTYMSLVHDVVFTEMSEKGDQTDCITRSCCYVQIVPRIE